MLAKHSYLFIHYFCGLRPKKDRREKFMLSLCVCVCVCERERERECVCRCVCLTEREKGL